MLRHSSKFNPPIARLHVTSRGGMLVGIGQGAFYVGYPEDLWHGL